MSRRGLQVVLGILGAVAFVFGGLALFTGVSFISGGETASASVDSELRFYAAWYAAAGVGLLLAVPRVESATTTIRVLFSFLFVAACGRAISIVVVGAPHRTFVILMIIEFALPLVVIPWQTVVARRYSKYREA